MSMIEKVYENVDIVFGLIGFWTGTGTAISVMWT